MSADKQKIAPIDDAVKKALSDVRAPDHGPNAFVVLTYSEPNVLAVKGEGAGGLTEALELFTDEEASYALIRKDVKVEMANTVKYAFVAWIPQTLKPMRRALVSTHKGQVSAIFKPYQVDADLSEKSELNEEQLTQKMYMNAGIISKIGDGKPAEPAEQKSAEAAAPAPSGPVRPSPLPPQTKASAAPKFAAAGPGGSVGIEDEAAFSEVLKQVKSDKSETNWVVAVYDNKKLAVLGSGTGGVTEMVEKIDDNRPCFAFVRVTEIIDGKSKTTKFAFVRSLPVNTKPMVKGDLNTKRGAIDKLFQPWHVDLTVEHKSEVSEAIIMDLVGNASGSKSHIVHRD